MSLLTYNDLVGMVRVQIRDICTPQVFPDVVDPSTKELVVNNSPQLTQFVRAALGEFSQYRSLRRPYTLNIVAGTTTYSLPADWMLADRDSFEAALHPHHHHRRHRGGPSAFDELGLDGFTGVFDGFEDLESGPVDSSTHWYTFYDDLQQLVFGAPPAADRVITFDYLAVHSPSTLPPQWVEVALAPAYERALRALATDQAVKLQLYKIANGIEVDNRVIAKHLLAQADAWKERWREEVVMRPFGTVG